MNLLRIIVVSAIVFAFDRILKIWVVEWMNLRDVLAIDVWPPYLNLRMAWNDGVNFGLFGSDTDTTRTVLIGISVVISLILLIWVRKARGWLVPVSTGLVIGGAMGNAYDRMVFGAVADFLNMSCCGINNPFSFNPADAAIFIGVIGLVLFMDQKPKKP